MNNQQVALCVGDSKKISKVDGFRRKNDQKSQVWAVAELKEVSRLLQDSGFSEAKAETLESSY